MYRPKQNVVLTALIYCLCLMSVTLVSGCVAPKIINWSEHASGYMMRVRVVSTDYKGTPEEWIYMPSDSIKSFQSAEDVGPDIPLVSQMFRNGAVRYIQRIEYLAPYLIKCCRYPDFIGFNRDDVRKSVGPEEMSEYESLISKNLEKIDSIEPTQIVVYIDHGHYIVSIWAIDGEYCMCQQEVQKRFEVKFSLYYAMLREVKGVRPLKPEETDAWEDVLEMLASSE